MRRLGLDQLRATKGFALLGPGFDTHGQWTLLTHLAPAESGDAALWLADYETPGARASRLSGTCEAVELELPSDTEPIAAAVDDATFLEGVATIREAIAAGDVYQVNLTVRARLAPVDGGALLARLCRRSPPRFAAWVRLPGQELVSASPELLFELRGGVLHAEPMKGTAPAGQRAWLEASEKDQAELAMITDLLRDDLNQLCEPGSVDVPCPRRFIELPYVVQAVSDVTGRLPRSRSLREVVGQLHPGGSVTGAPREAARRMIAALEPTPRGAYCGTLGLERSGEATFALLIRTAQRTSEGEWVYGVGSGITWDSVAAHELDEVRLKLGAL